MPDQSRSPNLHGKGQPERELDSWMYSTPSVRSLLSGAISERHRVDALRVTCPVKQTDWGLNCWTGTAGAQPDTMTHDGAWPEPGERR